MRKLWTVCYFTFRESLSRKTFIAFFIVSTVTLLLFLFALNVDVVDGALRGLSLFGNEARDIKIDASKLVNSIESAVATGLYTLGLFLSIFATSSLVPNMLQKGHIEWLLSKPISRTQLMLGRYLGALLIVAFNVFYLIGGSWLILSAKTGVWNFAFLLSGVLIVALFAVFYALMIFLGVLVQNAAVSIMGAFLAFFISNLLSQRDRIYALLSEKIYQLLLDALYYLTPRTFEVGEIVTRSTIGQPIQSWTPVWHSLLLGVFYFALTAVLFNRKNF